MAEINDDAIIRQIIWAGVEQIRVRQVIRNADGEIIAATCVSQPLTDAEQAALAEVIEAARRDFAERDADGSLSARQQQARERNRARLRRLGLDRESQ